MRGQIFTGCSADGSDAAEFCVPYVSPCGNYWGNQPFDDDTIKQFSRAARKKAWKQRMSKLIRL